YTALTEAHGNLSAARAGARYAEIAADVLEPGARVLERVGDEVLIAGDECAAIVRTALGLQAAIAREPSFPSVRCGIHVGLVIEDEGRYVGGALNLTARVAAYARGGQTLCTMRIVE